MNIEFGAKTIAFWTEQNKKKKVKGTKLYTFSGDKILRTTKRISYDDESVRMNKWKYNLPAIHRMNDHINFNVCVIHTHSVWVSKKFCASCARIKTVSNVFFCIFCSASWNLLSGKIVCMCLCITNNIDIHSAAAHKWPFLSFFPQNFH